MITGKIALVTGAGSGIGRAVSIELANQGYALVLAGRRAELLDATAGEILKAGQRAVAIPTDLADPDAIVRLFARVRAEFGRLDLLFNNAGSGARAVPLEQLTVAEWKAVIDVNLTAAFICTQQAFLIMKDQDPRGGRIINNGSLSAHVPRPNSAPYTSSKHAITGLTRSTALDGRKYNIACGQIDVGNANTPMRAHAAKGQLQPNGTVYVEPGMDVQHVARAVGYMASLPLDANVLSLNVMATAMPFVGRG